MTSNSMSSVVRKFSTIACYQIGSTRILRSLSSPDYNSIVMGLALWYGIILDYNVMFCNAEREQANRGRIMKHAIDGWPVKEVILSDFLTSLDELGDILIKNVSSKHRFKADVFLMELKTWIVPSWIHPIKGCILEIIRAGLTDVDDQGEVRVIKAVRQIACFLKKLDVARADLVDQTKAEFFSFEEFLSRDIPERIESTPYQKDVAEMRCLLRRHLKDFKMEIIVPGHGPGAVSDPTIKSWYEKHTKACIDDRVGYLLAHTDLGYQSDYLPFVTGERSDRTSRYITVPKTWKKLRGISAEPPELQFWQQGIRQSIDDMFCTSKWWSSRINLHSQERSRRLAQQGSIDGSLATVDLSAASDSVTLQLVRDLFGNTLLGRWLLGTRSVFTSCDTDTIRINKFAPMGSACCFPVECIVFCLAAEVAVRRTRKPSQNNRQVCVYGDDIIVPSYAVQELFSILSHLGFSVNSEKSFWVGDFREACGIEAWRGHDIAPCRFSTWVSGYYGRRSDYGEIASLVAFANELFARGLHDTRAFLLSVLFDKKILLGNKQEVRVQSTISTSFSGEGGSLASPYATNFNLKRKFDRSLWTHVYRRVVWQKRPITRNIGEAMAATNGVCEYVSWLIRHQPGASDFDKIWSNGWIESTVSNPYDRLPIGMTMVPTLKWVTPSTLHFQSI